MTKIDVGLHRGFRRKPATLTNTTGSYESAIDMIYGALQLHARESSNDGNKVI